MLRWKSMVVGGLAFLVSHALEVVEWRAFDPAGAHRPWFLNAGGAVLFTASWLVAAAAVEGAVAARDPRDAIGRGAQIAAGAIVAMIVVILFVGPGTLFPIAVAIGAVVAAVAAVSGALIGWGLRRLSRGAGLRPTDIDRY
jgi:hypothetical protein